MFTTGEVGEPILCLLAIWIFFSVKHHTFATVNYTYS